MSGHESSLPVFHQKSKFHWFEIKRYRLRMALIMLCADLLGFGIASVILFILNLWTRLFFIQWSDLKYLVVVVICLAFYSSTKLYPGIGLNPAEEIRLVVANTSVGFLLGVFILGSAQTYWHLNSLALIPFGLLSTAFILTLRWVFRFISARAGIWGAPVVVIGTGRDANKLARYFLNRSRLGFVPKYVISDVAGDRDVTVPVITLDMDHLLNCPDDYFSSQQIYTAMIETSHVSEMFYSPMLSRLSQLFPRLIYISDHSEYQNTSFQVHDFEGVMGVETSKNLPSPFDVLIKRSMDIVFSLVLLIFTFPIWAVTMLLIRLDSPGPICYSQLRVGKNRHNARNKERLTGHVRMIRIYKFRTMVVNAERALEKYLNTNPQARKEWDQTQKLFHDPRITRVGKWLRKFSIDELPQLINVLKGEMSLVGPRPIVTDEIYHYEDSFEVYTSVCPGITGLWQVSGRNHTSYEERVGYDTYYVHNWSIWLDMYILLRTVWVVLSRDGAY